MCDPFHWRRGGAHVRSGVVRAVVVSRPGGPEVLRVVDLPTPEPGPGQVRIRTRTAAVNPTDTAFRQLGPDPEEGVPQPWIPGMELAGTVDATGAGVDWRPGQRVMAIVTPRRPEGGAYAEQVVVPADGVAATPDGVGDAEAATLPMNGLTVWAALRMLALSPGQVLGVTGAAGAVGGYAIELGKLAGLRVVAQAAVRDEDLVRRLGADVVVPRDDDAAAAFRAAVPGGVDGLLDAAVLDERALGAVRDGGALATVRFWSGPSERGIRVEPVMVRHHLHEAKGLADLASLAQAGSLTLRVAEVLPAERASEAHARLESGGIRGRLVLAF
jgi:NADPH:quinone reductase